MWMISSPVLGSPAYPPSRFICRTRPSAGDREYGTLGKWRQARRPDQLSERLANRRPFMDAVPLGVDGGPQCRESLPVHRVPHPFPPPFAVDQTGITQDLEVMGDGWL